MSCSCSLDSCKRFLTSWQCSSAVCADWFQDGPDDDDDDEEEDEGDQSCDDEVAKADSNISTTTSTTLSGASAKDSSLISVVLQLDKLKNLQTPKSTSSSERPPASPQSGFSLIPSLAEPPEPAKPEQPPSSSILGGNGKNQGKMLPQFAIWLQLKMHYMSLVPPKPLLLQSL